jgi:hypothetical protein
MCNAGPIDVRDGAQMKRLKNEKSSHVTTKVKRQRTVGRGSDWFSIGDGLFGTGQYLMDVFDNTTALDQATKDRIRHRLWARVSSMKYKPISGSDADAFVAIGALLGGLLGAVALSVLWSGGHGVLARAGAAGIAILIWVGTLFVLSEQGLGKVVPFNPALYIGIAAIAVLGIRSVPLAHSFIAAWTIAGLRAGFVGAIITVSGLLVMWLGEPIFTWMGDRKRWSQQPEASIVTGLLHLLANLKSLDDLRLSGDELIQGTIARNKRRDELMKQLSESGTRKVHTSESTDVKKRRDGTFLETFNLESQRDDGSWETVLHEERVLSVPDIFHEDPQWLTVRKNFAIQVEDVARYIERGLPAQLKVGSARLDEWLKQELHGRAQTVRSWAQLVALPSKSGYQDLLVQVGTALEHAAEEQWAAIPSNSYAEPERWGRRILRLARHAAVGIIPLLVVVATPKIGIVIPPALRDSLFTFAIPWILLQLIELIVPNAGDYLSRSKTIRELLPSRRSDKE